MVKIDAICFARLISRITVISQQQSMDDSLNIGLIDELQYMVKDCIIEPPPANTVVVEQLDALLEAIQQDKKIDAVKAYRAMAPCDLVTAKNAVEKYWYSKVLA